MMKQAMCVLTRDVLKLNKELIQNGLDILADGVSDVLCIKPLLVDREICETDTKFLQLIPYVTVLSGDKVFVYRRDSGSNETRLIDKHSIGLGGHIDTLPSKCSIFEHIVAEAARELEEEVNLNPDVTTPLLAEALTNAKLVYSSSTPVSQVHLGISIIIDVGDAVVTSNELDTISDTRWLPITELETMRTNGQLEDWSTMVSYRVNYSENSILTNREFATTPSDIRIRKSLHRNLMEY
jgi:predicted NUDIX family phosphoesterase